MTTIINCTPHAISIIVDGKTETFEPSGIIPRVETKETQGNSIGGLPCVIQAKGEVTGLPDQKWEAVSGAAECPHCGCPAFGDECCGDCGHYVPERAVPVFFIVSGMVFSASDRTDLIAPDTGKTAVRNEKGHIVAVTRFLRK